jgi:hypothetical protein
MLQTWLADRHSWEWQIHIRCPVVCFASFQGETMIASQQDRWMCQSEGNVKVPCLRVRVDSSWQRLDSKAQIQSARWSRRSRESCRCLAIRG